MYFLLESRYILKLPKIWSSVSNSVKLPLNSHTSPTSYAHIVVDDCNQQNLRLCEIIVALFLYPQMKLNTYKNVVLELY